MSKRKNRTQSPNIPQSTLDRARQQITGTSEPVAAVEAKVEKVAAVVEQAEAVARPVVERRARPARPAGSPPRITKHKEDKHDMAFIRARLANPTRIVTEDQLKQEYSYVVKDLRWMGGLAAILVVALVVIEKLL
jgi:hypothetical protein